MRNLITKISLGAAALLMLLLMLPGAAADTIQLTDKSIFTPDRPGVQFTEGMLGFDYVSFNNFLNNPRIIEGGRKGDERKFLLGYNCQETACPQQGTFLMPNTATPELHKGDHVLFEIYFHNNGDDPYNNNNVKSPDATNVEIGVNFDETKIVDSTNSDILRPVGFIKADNNQYKNIQNITMTDAAGNIIRTATDDMQLIAGETGLKFKAIPGTTGLKILLDGNNQYFNKKITSSTDITFTGIENVGSTTVTATPVIGDKSMKIKFDRLPGCFRYSGFAYFEAEVIGEEPPETNVCSSLSLTDPQPLQICNDSSKSTNFKVTVKLQKPTPVPETQYVTITSSDKNSTLKIKEENSYNEVTPANLTNGLQNFIVELQPEDVAHGIYSVFGAYTGLGELKAYYSDWTGQSITGFTQQNGTTTVDIGISKPCTTSIPACGDDCKQMSTVVPPAIYRGSWSVMTAKDALSYYGDHWANDKINYSVEEGYGKFYNDLPSLLADHPDAFANPSNPQDLLDQAMLPLVQNLLDNVIFQGLSPQISYNQNPSYLQANVLLALNPITNQNTPSGNTQLIPTPPINPVPLIPITNIQATGGKVVLFYAEKPGSQVIEIQADQTQSAPCTRKLDIVDYMTCNDKIEGTVDNLTTGEKQPKCSKPEEILKININKIPLSNGTIINPNILNPAHKIIYKWSLAPNSGVGQFSAAANGTFTNDLFIENPTVYFKGYGRIIGEVISIDGFPAETGCYFEYMVPLCATPETCANLTATFEDGTNQMIVGETKNINYKVTSNLGHDFFSTVKWDNTAGGSLTFSDDYSAQKSGDSWLSVYPTNKVATLNAPTQGGVLTATVVDPQGYEKVCTTNLFVRPGFPDVCKDLTLKFQDGSKTMSVGETKPLVVTTESVQGTNPYPITILWNNLTDVPLTFPNGQSIAPSSQLGLKYPDSGAPIIKNPSKLGSVSAAISSLNPVEVAACNDHVSVVEGAVCKSLNLTLVTKGQISVVPPTSTLKIKEEDLKAGDVSYLIDPQVEFSTPEDATVSYYTTLPATNVNYGCFSKGVLMPLPATPIPETWRPETDASGEIICTSSLASVPADNPVFFFPNKDLEAGTYQNVISITVDGTLVPDCEKFLSLEISPEVVLEPCKYIGLKSIPSPFTAADDTQVLIDSSLSDFGDFQGNFFFEINPGLLEQKLPNGGIITNTKFELSLFAATNPLRGVYTLNAFPPVGETTTVTVTANEPNTTCKAILQTPPTQVKKCENLEILQPTNPWYGSEDFLITASPSQLAYSYKWEKIEGGGYSYFQKPFTSGPLQGTLALQNKFIDGVAGDRVRVSVSPEFIDPLHPLACVREISIQSQTNIPITPEITKKVRAEHGNSYRDVINVDTSQETIDYQIKVTQLDQTGSIEIDESDDMNGGIIEGDQGGYLELDEDSIEIDVGWKSLGHEDYELDDIDDCDELAAGHKNDFCKNDDFSDGFISFENLNQEVSSITITYTMDVHSISAEECKTMKAKSGCGEEFDNKVKLAAYSDNKLISFTNRDSDTAKVIVICPYILTRTAGDTFFKSTDEIGDYVDIAYCSPQKNFGGPFIKFIPPPEDEIEGETGTKIISKELQLPSHDICKYSNIPKGTEGTNNIVEYQNPLENFSSTICESEAEVAKIWETNFVINQIKNNMNKITYWTSPQGAGMLTNIDQLNGKNGIYLWDKDLTIGTYTVEASNSIPAGQTYIIKNANLHIKGNIKYGTDFNISDPKTVPSAAFIVIDGNIIIDKDVSELWGTFIAVDTDGIGSDGQVTSGGNGQTRNVTSKAPLTIYGSLIGNVTNLFSNRLYAGDIASDQGSVTIKYVENLILNTPPGLSQLMDVSQLRVAE